MLLLLLLLPLGGLEILVIPAAIWTVGPPSWHLPLAVFIGLTIALACYVMMRRMQMGSAERSANLAGQAGWRWPPTMAPDQFRLRLATYLLLHGWRMGSSMVNAAGRVEVMVRQDRCTLAMLCMGPSHSAPAATDIARLAAMKAEGGASHAVLVCATPRGVGTAALPAGMMDIRYEDLARLDQAIGLQVGYFAAV